MEEIPKIETNFDVIQSKREFDKLIRDAQHDALYYLLAGLLIIALLFLGGMVFFDDPIWTFGLFFLILLLTGLVWLIQRWNYLVASWCLIGGLTMLLLHLVSRGEIPAAFYLLSLPVGISALLISRRSGFLASVILSLAIFLPFDFLPTYTSQEKIILCLLAWVTVGLVWITFRPLISSLDWAWNGYRTSTSLLDQAQDYQFRLLQTMEQLKDANQQLTRLNQLAHKLRVMAEEERHTKEQFVATVSHELRTPLNMIIGFSEMIINSPKTYSQPLPAALLSDLKVVLRNSQHLSSLIDDVLDLSQIEAGQMTLVREMVTMESLVEAVTIAVKPLFDSKKLFLRTQIPPGLPPIFCDKKRIREVLLNLLSNAGRFTDTGGVEVIANQEGNNILVHVIDTGKGLDSVSQAKLFQPFQQIEPTIKQRFGGTGLGLAISKQFIELHEGKIWVDSSPGKGTTFSFQLPITPPPPLDPGALRWFNPYQPYEERVSSKRQIETKIVPRLIVIEKGNFLQHLLRHHWENIEVINLKTIEEVFDYTKNAPADLLLINDQQITEQINDSPAEYLPDCIPTIFLDFQENILIPGELGVLDYLVKPISSQTLLESIENLGKPVSNILVVDDDPDALQLFSRILTGSGKNYRIQRAMNGLQVMQLVSTEPPDVILLDITMPEMDGFETIASLKSQPSTSVIPIIITSARDPSRSPGYCKSFQISSRTGLSNQIVLDSLTAISQVFAHHGQSAPLIAPATPHG